MKQNLITDIIQGMLPYLNNVQSKRLQEVLQSAFVNYEITENTGNMKESERNYVEIFLSAKRIEGCSEKSLRYYKTTIDWQKRDSARAKMRMMIKKLLKKHKYPPEGMDDAVQTVMLQCELWTDNTDMMGERTSNYASRLNEYVSEINNQ